MRFSDQDEHGCFSDIYNFNGMGWDGMRSDSLLFVALPRWWLRRMRLGRTLGRASSIKARGPKREAPKPRASQRQLFHFLSILLPLLGSQHAIRTNFPRFRGNIPCKHLEPSASYHIRNVAFSYSSTFRLPRFSQDEETGRGIRQGAVNTCTHCICILRLRGGLLLL